MTRRLLMLVGVIFLVLGVLGFISPGLGGTHLSPVHNLIHLVSGALALYFSRKPSSSSIRQFSLVFGLIYFALGILGFVFGDPGATTLSYGPTGHMDSELWRIIPGSLEWGRRDHILHIVLGIVLIANALMEWKRSTNSVSQPKIPGGGVADRKAF